MAAGTISGKRLHIRINGTLLRGVQDFNFDYDVDELDGTTGEDLGFDHPDDGCAKGTLQTTLVYRVGETLYVPVKPGTLVSNVAGYLTEDETAQAVDIPVGKVFKVGIAVKVKDKITVPVTIKTVGPFTINDIDA